MIRERNRLGYLVLVVFALMTTPAYPLNNRSAVSITGSDAAFGAQLKQGTEPMERSSCFRPADTARSASLNRSR